jgi:hypothetical protein
MDLKKQHIYINENRWYNSEEQYSPIKVSYDKRSPFKLKMGAWKSYQLIQKD